MVGWTSRTKIARLWALWCLVLLVGCSQDASSGCDCAEPIPGGFPKAQTKKNVGQIALTRKGFDFLEQNNQVIIQQFLPNGLNFEVPKSTGGDVEVCLNPPCKVSGKVNKLGIQLIPGKTLRINTNVNIKSNKIKIRVKRKIIVTIRKTCDVEARINNKPIRVDIALGIDPRNQGLTFTVGKPVFDLKSRDFKVSGDIICSGINLLKGLFSNLIEKQIQKAVQGAVSDATCMKCKAKADCPAGATCKDGTCQQNGKCLPLPLGIEGQASLAALLGTFGNASSKKMMYSVKVGARADVKTTGLYLGTLGGTHAESHPCVPKKTRPNIPSAKIFNFPPQAPDQKAYMLGMAFSDTLFKKAGFDLYQSGSLCIDIDKSLSSQLEGLLNAQGLGAIISPSLLQLSKNAPMYIGLRPSQPPNLRIGKGTLKTDAKGKKVIDEPLLELEIPRLGFDFFMLLHDRWIRLFTYRVDLVLPLGLEVRPGNKLGLILGDLGSALSNPSIENSNILKEEPQKMANGLHNLIKTFIPLATGQIGNQEFDLPDLQGFKITIRGINGQIPAAGSPKYYQFLTMYADLGLATKSQPQMPAEPIQLQLRGVHIPKDFTQKLYARQLVKQYPSVAFEITNNNPEREYSVRIGKSMWTPFSSQRRYNLESPLFLLQGRHVISVRSRDKNNRIAPSHGSGWIAARVDYTAPKLVWKATKEGLVLDVTDNLDATHNLRVEHRDVRGSWQPLASNNTIPATQYDNNTRVQIRVTDRAKNVSVRNVVWQWQPVVVTQQGSTVPSAPAQTAPAQETQPKVASGCQATPTPPTQGLLFLAFLLLGGLTLRRRP